MNKAIRAGVSIALAITTLGFITAAAHAAGTSNCQVIYGGGEVCEKDFKFSIDKLVQRPNKDGEFVDNINTNDTRFRAGDTVTFRIKVTNTGKDDIATLNITDTLPENVTFKAGPGNANGRTVTYTINDLKAGQTQEHDISVTVNTDLPADKGVMCLTNNVKGSDNHGNEAKDDASFCVEKEVVTSKPTPQVYDKTPVKNIPNTGPEMLPLLGLIPAGLLGAAMRRKNKLG